MEKHVKSEEVIVMNWRYSGAGQTLFQSMHHSLSDAPHCLMAPLLRRWLL